MPETPTDVSKTVDLSKVAVGSFANLGGMSVNYARDVVYGRAGVLVTDEPRCSLSQTHACDDGLKLPDTFPPDDFEGKLETAQDYLDLIDAAEQSAAATEKAAQAAEKVKSNLLPSAPIPTASSPAVSLESAPLETPTAG